MYRKQEDESMKLALELSKKENGEGNQLEGNEEEDTADDDLLGITDNSISVVHVCLYSCFMYMCIHMHVHLHVQCTCIVCHMCSHVRTYTCTIQ